MWCEKRHSFYICPIVVLVDTSASLQGDAMQNLNQGLVFFGDELCNHPKTFDHADVSVLSFDSCVRTEQTFCRAEDYEAPYLFASGLTSLNAAINAALDAIEDRKRTYKQAAVRYGQPQLFVLTDGAPTDVSLEDKTRTRLQSALTERRLRYVPVAIGDRADVEKLRSYYPFDAQSREVWKVGTDRLARLFSRISATCAEQITRDLEPYQS